MNMNPPDIGRTGNNQGAGGSANNGGSASVWSQDAWSRTECDRLLTELEKRRMAADELERALIHTTELNAALRTERDTLRTQRNDLRAYLIDAQEQRARLVEARNAYHKRHLELARAIREETQRREKAEQELARWGMAPANPTVPYTPAATYAARWMDDEQERRARVAAADKAATEAVLSAAANKATAKARDAERDQTRWQMSQIDVLTRDAYARGFKKGRAHAITRIAIAVTDEPGSGFSLASAASHLESMVGRWSAGQDVEK